MIDDDLPIKILKNKDSLNWWDLSKDISLPWTLDLIEKYKDKWKWRQLSMNPLLPWSVELIEKYERKWKYKELSWNPSLPWSIGLIEKYEDKWDWRQLLSNPSFLRSLDLIEKYRDKLNWEKFSYNPPFPWSVDLIEKYKDKWNWETLSRNTSLPWSVDLIEKYKNKWDWETLSRNASLPWTLDLIEKYKDEWDWGKLMRKRLILSKYRKKTPDWLFQIAEYMQYSHDTLDEQTLRNRIMQLLYTNIHEILENSCFYYCADRDITPIVALEGYIHSFIYCDNNEPCYNETLSNLKNRLRFRRHKEIQSENIDFEYFERLGLYLIIPDNVRIEEPRNGNFSIWEKDGQLYSLLYFCWDAISVWKNLYERYSIYPIVVCDINSRGSNMHDIWNINNIPKYVIGNMGNNQKFERFLNKKIGIVDYLGDFAHSLTLWKVSNPYY